MRFRISYVLYLVLYQLADSIRQHIQRLYSREIPAVDELCRGEVLIVARENAHDGYPIGPRAADLYCCVGYARLLLI